LPKLCKYFGNETSAFDNISDQNTVCSLAY